MERNPKKEKGSGIKISRTRVETMLYDKHSTRELERIPKIILNLLLGEIDNNFKNWRLLWGLNKSRYRIASIVKDPKLKITPGRSHDSIGTPLGEKL